MAEGLSSSGPVLATDICAPLIALYRAIRLGWDPPESVTQEQWEAAKSLPDSDPLKGFCGFGASFNGIYFSRYVEPQARLTIGSGPSARLSTRRYHAAIGAVLRRQLPKIAAVECADFLNQPIVAFDGVLYCDPPYRGTTGYPGAPSFSHDRFYTIVQQWAAVGVPVFISEYSCPVGRCVFERPSPRGCTMAKSSAVERLFLVA